MDDETRSAVTAELLEVNGRIEEAEGKLRETVGPEYEAQREVVGAAKGRLEAIDRRLKELYSKRGRLSQFETEADRDEWLQREIASIRKQHKGKGKSVSGLKAELKALEKETRGAVREVEKASEDKARAQQEAEAAGKELSTKRSAREAAVEARKKHWRVETDLERSLGGDRDELKRARKTFGKLMPPGLGESIDRVMEYVYVGYCVVRCCVECSVS